jgi:predicted transcriptional regulator
MKPDEIAKLLGLPRVTINRFLKRANEVLAEGSHSGAVFRNVPAGNVAKKMVREKSLSTT